MKSLKHQKGVLEFPFHLPLASQLWRTESFSENCLSKMKKASICRAKTVQGAPRVFWSMTNPFRVVRKCFSRALLWLSGKSFLVFQVHFHQSKPLPLKKTKQTKTSFMDTSDPQQHTSSTPSTENAPPNLLERGQHLWCEPHRSIISGWHETYWIEYLVVLVSLEFLEV